VTKACGITQKTQKRTTLFRLLCTILSISFLFVQSVSSAHAHEHDHSHEAPTNEPCVVCVLATQTDDDEFSLVKDDSSDDEFWSLPKPKNNTCSRVLGLDEYIRPPSHIGFITRSGLMLGQVRAPPL
jgi:hypothetical protein